MRKLDLVSVLSVSLLALGLVVSLYRLHFPPGPVADEAAYLMLTESIWHDQDLEYTRQDLDRAFQTWDQGPYGLILLTRDGGETMFYGKPFVYPLVATPFYAVFGPQGLMVLNMVLYLAMFWAAWVWFGHQGRWVPLLLAGFFFASVSFAYVFWLHPEVFNMACVFFALGLWQRLRARPEAFERSPWRSLAWLFVAGGLVAAAFVSKEVLLVLGVPIGIDLLLGRRFKGAAAYVAGLVLVTLVLVGAQWKETGTWSPYRDAQRISFTKSFPLQDTTTDHWALYRGTSFGSWSGIGVSATPQVLWKDLQYFVFGRHVGLLPYFPFALFVLLLYLLGPKDRSRHLLALAVVAYCLVIFLVRPYNFHGGAGFLGNRYFASLYPVLLFLPASLAPPGWPGLQKAVVAPFLAAGLWVAPVLFTPVQQVAPEFGLQVHARSAAHRLLPLELTLLPGGRIPGYFLENWGQGVWVVPKENWFVPERHPDGVWVRGSSRSEVHVASPIPLGTIRFVAQSLSDANRLTVSSGGRSVTVRFDSPQKRAGTPIEIVPERVATDLHAFFRQTPHEYVYRLELETTHGLVPARLDPESTDERYLGVFLRFAE